MDGRRSRRLGVRACTLAASLLLAAAGLSACGGSSTSDAEEKAQQQHAAAMTAGRQLFAANCSTCHALGGRPRGGSTGEYGPNLDKVKPKRAYVLHRIELGGYGMQSFASELTAREKQQLATFVAEASGRDVPRSYPVPAATLASGEAAFDKYCQTCHAIADKQRTGRPMFPGTNLNNVRQSPEQVQHQIDDGEWWMPRMYERVPRRAVHDVIEYVVSVSGRGPDRYEEP